MNFKVTFSKEATHSELVSCVGWASSSDLYSIGDDHSILKWNVLADEVLTVAKLPQDVYCTDIHWYPAAAVGTKKQSVQSELFVLACTDGRFLLVSKAGRVEKAVEGHKGAVLGTRWGHDGTTLLTFGEDAAVKVWSRTGMLRSVLAQSSSPVYAAAWSPDSNQVIYTAASTLVVKSLQPSVKPSQWKAHDALILAVDWSASNGLVISAGEDRKYKVWDSYGRALYSSHLHDSPIISLAWAPDGELFAVGGFNTLRLCDKAGWSHSLEKPSCGTILQLAWSMDSTQVGGACGSGQVLMAHVVGRRLEWRHLTAVVNDDNTITVKNVLNDSNEHLEFNDKVVRVSMDWGHLVVATTTTGFIYREHNWTTPVTFDLRSKTVNLLKQAERHFLVAEAQGLQILNYEGRVLSNIRYPGLQTDSLNTHTVSICNDTVAVKSKQEPNIIRLFDVTTGKELRDGNTLQHKAEVKAIALSHAGPQQNRQLAFTDKNHDLYLTHARGTNLTTQPVMLGSMVTSLVWNSGCNMLAGMQNNKLLVWYHPAVVYTDRDLLPLTVVDINKRGFSKSPQVVKFLNDHCTLHRSDGAAILARVSPYPAVLHQHVLSNKWTEAVRLCRLAKSPELWACLAGMSAASRELSTATIAYASINEVDKVQHLNSIQQLASSERRNAELALFAHQPQLAEGIYLQAKMVFRAIEVNLNLFNWERALELAVRHKTHVDTVLAFRQRYLQDMGITEKSKKFKQYSDKITVDWEKVEAKLAMEAEN